MATGSNLRVLFGTYPWAFETPGGGEIQLRKYAEHLSTLGADVRLHDPWKKSIADASVFHFFSCLAGSVHFCSYIKQQGLPLVISSSLWITEQTAHLYPRDEIRAQLSLADIIVTNSNAESERLCSVLDLPLDRMATIFNGFDPRFASADPQLFRDRFDIRDPFVLNVANIEPRKNQLGLVRAMKALAMPLVLIGARRDQAYAHQVLAEGGPLVRYLGPLEHADPLLASAFASCAVFALPSTLETPGLAALEAAASGAPLVVTSEGSAREYFAGHAHYVDHDNQADVRDKIALAMESGRNFALKRHVMSNFTWGRVTEGLLDVYRAAIARCRTRRIEWQ
jgi:glycosyltransferase involved in cell wall biosynthesis